MRLTLPFFFSLPSMSDSARKRKLADFVVAWKKQVVKLYAVAKWSRDADIVQKCMVRRPPTPFLVACLTHFRQNITAFLMNQNRQFDDVIHGLTYARDSLDGARCVALSLQAKHAPICVLMDNRLRNHDLLTSLDVLTTGSYRRLPTTIRVWTFTQLTRRELKMATEIHYTTSSPD